jgi:hypothetical protein
MGTTTTPSMPNMPTGGTPTTTTPSVNPPSGTSLPSGGQTSNPIATKPECVQLMLQK